MRTSFIFDGQGWLFSKKDFDPVFSESYMESKSANTPIAQILRHLLTYIGVFGLDFVSKLLPDEAAQTHNPYTILIPY